MGVPEGTKSWSFTDVVAAIVAVLVIVPVILVVLAPAVPPPGMRETARKVSEQSSMRQVSAALHMRAGYYHGAAFPHAADRETRSTTTDVFAAFPAEAYLDSGGVLVSPRERNKNIEDYTGTAGQSGDASSWDPPFSADFTDPIQPAHVSFAHTGQLDAKLDELEPWALIVALRGPEPGNSRSIWLTRGTWVGGSTLRADGSVSWTEDPADVTDSLGIWIEAGDGSGELKRIWD